MDSMGFHEAFNIRVDELQVLSMEFLYDCPRPTVALLYHDNKDVRHLRTYEISLKDKVSFLLLLVLLYTCTHAMTYIVCYRLSKLAGLAANTEPSSWKCLCQCGKRILIKV